VACCEPTPYSTSPANGCSYMCDAIDPVRMAVSTNRHSATIFTLPAAGRPHARSPASRLDETAEEVIPPTPITIPTSTPRSVSGLLRAL
jgi:hypothetical protein